MKTKLQKQKEALARISANIVRTVQNIEKHRALAGSWKRPVLTASSTTDERRAYILTPKENPFLSMVELETHHLKRMENEQQRLKNKSADSRTTGYL